MNEDYDPDAPVPPLPWQCVKAIHEVANEAGVDKADAAAAMLRWSSTVLSVLRDEEAVARELQDHRDRLGADRMLADLVGRFNQGRTDQ